MGATAIRSAAAFPGLQLAGVITSSPDKEGKDAATFARLEADTGVAATTDVDAEELTDASPDLQADASSGLQPSASQA